MVSGDYYERYWSAEGYRPEGRLVPGLDDLLERHVHPRDDCIDVGCGDGGTSGTWLDAHAASYVGVDVSKNAVEAAQARGLNAVQVPDASELPFEDDAFDLAVCVEVLEHLLDPAATAREIRRVLRTGGRLLVTVPNVAFWRRRADLALLGRWKPAGDPRSVEEPWRDPHIRFFNPRALERMLDSCGFGTAELGGFSGVSFFTELPGLRRFVRSDRPGPVYRRLQRALPSLFGQRVFALAVKA